MQQRLDNRVWHTSAPRQLPIFDGLLLTEDEVGYDCACILPSVRRLGTAPPEPDAPSFSEACGLVRTTRAIIDPAAVEQPREKIKDYIGGSPIPVMRNRE